jgi:hypothetical protein
MISVKILINGGKDMIFYCNKKDELYHDGIKRRSGRYPWGSGARPYQSEERSKRKKAQDLSDEELQEAVRRKTLEKSYDKLYPKSPGKLEVAKKSVDSARDLTREAKKLVPEKPQGKERMDLSNMTDQELRNRINRELLEKQYSDLFGDPIKEPKGKAFVREALEIGGTILAVGSTALGIALGIKQLKE